MAKKLTSNRKSKKRAYRKLYIVVTEGAKTEKAYFENIKDLYKASNTDKDDIIHIEVVPNSSNHSDPNHLIDKAKEKESNSEFRKDIDEIWIIHDKDSWDKSQLSNLKTWGQEEEFRHLAISVPYFEYWILLHYCDGSGLKDKNPIDVLKKHIPNYGKATTFDFSLEQVKNACERAKKVNNEKHSDIYKLIEKILD